MSCIVFACKSHASLKKKNKECEYVSFHRLPVGSIIRELWIKNTPRVQEVWGHHSRICSKHFTKNCFININDRKGRRLKHDAIPTIFPDIDFREEVYTNPDESLNSNNVEKCKLWNPAFSGEERTATNIISDQKSDSVIRLVPEKFLIKNPAVSGERTAANIISDQKSDSVIRLAPEKFLIKNFIEEQIDLDDNNLLSVKPICCPELRKRIIQLEHDLKKSRKLSRKRFLKINALRQRTKRLIIKTNFLYHKLIDLLEK